MKKPLVIGTVTVIIITTVMIVASVPKQGLNQEMSDGVTHLDKMSENVQNLKIGLDCQ